MLTSSSDPFPFIAHKYQGITLDLYSLISTFCTSNLILALKFSSYVLDVALTSFIFSLHQLFHQQTSHFSLSLGTEFILFTPLITQF